MTIYVCRVDGQTFWSEAECHYHVDRHHPEWGHAVCVPGTPPLAHCTVCNTPFDSTENRDQHMVKAHGHTGGQQP